MSLRARENCKPRILRGVTLLCELHGDFPRRGSATSRRSGFLPISKTKLDLIADAPTRLDADKKREWAEQRYALDLAARHDAISAHLRPGSSIIAAFVDGELSVSIDDAPVIDSIFVNATEGEFIAAQWKVLAATFTITERTDGKKLANALRNLAVPDNPALVEQIIALEGELAALDSDIMQQEAEMNALVNRLYGLTEAEKLLVQKCVRPYPTFNPPC